MFAPPRMVGVGATPAARAGTLRPVAVARKAAPPVARTLLRGVIGLFTSNPPVPYLGET